jgi:hypothetical protein
VETDDFWIAASSKDKRFIHVAGIASLARNSNFCLADCVGVSFLEA